MFGRCLAGDEAQCLVGERRGSGEAAHDRGMLGLEDGGAQGRGRAGGERVGQS